jgi:hypothetical protein
MFEVDDILTYTPGGVNVTVTEVWDRHIMVMSDDDREEVFPVYEDEYELYEVA